MTDDNETQNRETTRESVDALRRSFVSIASCASESTDHELGLAAAVMTDLLTVAEMLCEDGASNARAEEIIGFCREEALPAMTDSDSGDQLQCLRQDVEDRWSECLSLLAPEERVSHQADASWAEAVDGGWEHSQHLVATDLAAAESEEVSDLPVDLEGILAALANQPAERADSDSEANAQQTPLDLSASAVPGELETIDDPEMVAAFADDAQQCLAEMEASLLSLEAEPTQDEPLRNFCRQLHTLKGASGTVGLTQLANFLHNLESYVEANSDGQIDVDRLFEGVDAVRAQLAFQANPAEATSAINDRVPNVAALKSSEAAAQSQQSPELGQTPKSTVSMTSTDNDLFVRVEASRLERLMDLLAELVMLRNRRDTYVDSLRTIHGELNHCASRTRTLTSTVELSAPDSSGVESSPGVHQGRQSAKRRLLSRSLDEVSKDTAELSRSLQEVFDPLADDNSAVSHLIGRFRQELMELRRLPVSGLFQRLQRAIRDAAKAEGKQVEIRFEGQGARAERSVQDRLFEPLLHLVRNAVSHGIQSENDRAQAGKSTTGRITLTAHSDASSLSITVQDDGCGLDDDALESRGRELGLLPLGETVSQSQLWKLIFHPGFSTKSSVSEISGRGVGMDVVHSWVRRLRGSIDVESVVGQGTTFRMQIPLRSAIEHAMVIRSSGQLFALPMHAVSGTSDVSLPVSGQRSDVSNASAIPLGILLGRGKSQSARCCHVTLRDTSNHSQPAPHRSGNDVTIVVDAVVGVEEVVVRSLPALLQRNELFAGVTLSGRAETVLLLDAHRLIALSQGFSQGESDANSVVCNHADAPDSQCILIVDDSVTVRRSLSKKLRASGHTVREAGNGRDALDAVKSGGVVAVVTDIDMPVMNGIELLQEIRHQRELSAIPVAVLTSRDEEALPMQTAHLQPTAILSKPVTDETITAIIESFASVLDSPVAT